MNLYTLTIYWTRPGAPVRLVFKSEERARAAHARLLSATDNDPLEDDFRQCLSVDTDWVAGVLFADLAEEANANIEIQLLSTHAQIRMMQRSEADPVIKEHAQRAQFLQNMANGARVVVPPSRQ